MTNIIKRAIIYLNEREEVMEKCIKCGSDLGAGNFCFSCREYDKSKEDVTAIVDENLEDGYGEDVELDEQIKAMLMAYMTQMNVCPCIGPVSRY